MLTGSKTLVFLCALVSVAGCGGGDQAPVAPKSAATGSGVISGKVFFDAPPPPKKSDKDESVIVNADGTLQNVIVYLKGAPAGEGGGPAVLLDQRGDHYTPHVIALQVGEALLVRNSDPHVHNVHINSEINSLPLPDRNFAMMEPGTHDPIVFMAPEFFEIKCDVHPWMICEVAVFDNPWFAVTGADGAYSLSNVPAGTYTLVARHERYGELTQSVTVGDKQTVSLEFHYKPPQ